MTQESGVSPIERIEQILAVESEPETVAEETPPAEAVELTAEAPTPEAGPEEPQPEQSEASEPEEAAEPEKYTIEDLAAALEIPVEDFLQRVSGTAKIDGQSESLPLGELLNGYQREADYTRKTQRLAEDRKAFEETHKANEESFQNRHAELANLLQVAEQLLVGSYDKAEMDQLRVNNPAEWSARNQEFQFQIQQLQMLKQQGVQQWQAQREKLDAEAKALAKTKAAESNAKLSEALAGWSDPVKQAQIKQDITQYLGSFGYSPEEVDGMNDHRMWLIANAAMQQQRAGHVSAEVASKLKGLPKVLRPGQKPSPQDASRNRLSNLREKLRKTGGVGNSVVQEILLEKMR